MQGQSNKSRKTKKPTPNETGSVAHGDISNDVFLRRHEPIPPRSAHLLSPSAAPSASERKPRTDTAIGEIREHRASNEHKLRRT
jgi:hypothetical protein